MKLTYWVAECLTDADCYSFRELTRGACAAMVQRYVANHNNSNRFGPVHKVTVQYLSAFDLLDQCLSEGGIYEYEAEIKEHA